MAERESRIGCPLCEGLRARIAELEAQLAKAQKHSGNSSKPPSSDIVKPAPNNVPLPKGQKRQRGGQPGHPRHERPAFTPDQLTAPPHEYTLDHCPDCGGTLKQAAAAPRLIQQVEIVVAPIQVEEHRARASWCAKCQKVHYAALPAEVVNAGLVGPRLTALVGFLKGGCHASFSTIRKFLRDVVGVTISRGQLAKVVAKVSQALDGPCQELLAPLPAQARLNVDETGHHDQGEEWWTWCFRAGLYTPFKIDPARSGDVLPGVLGEEFNGVL